MIPDSRALMRKLKMENLVIATFPAARGKFEELRATLAEALPETRAFDGCIRLEVYQEEGTETFTVVEDWESFDHYDRYRQWRQQTGMTQLLDGLLAGGIGGFRIQKFRARPDI